VVVHFTPNSGIEGSRYLFQETDGGCPQRLGQQPASSRGEVDDGGPERDAVSAITGGGVAAGGSLGTSGAVNPASLELRRPSPWRAADPTVRSWPSEPVGAASPCPILLPCSPASAPRPARPGQGIAQHLPGRRRIPALRALPQRGEAAPKRPRPRCPHRRAARRTRRMRDRDHRSRPRKAGEQGWRYNDNDWVSKHRQRQATGQWLPL